MQHLAYNGGYSRTQNMKYPVSITGIHIYHIPMVNVALILCFMQHLAYNGGYNRTQNTKYPVCNTGIHIYLKSIHQTHDQSLDLYQFNYSLLHCLI